MQPDPIYVIAAALSVSVILGSAATHKLRSPTRFANQLEDYRLLPGPLVRPVSRLLPWVEIALAFILLVPAARNVGGMAAAILLAVYAAAIAINLWRGRRDLDCGCAGPDQAQPIRAVLLARNAALVGLAMVASLAPGNRDLGVFDLFVVISASSVILFLYAAADGLMANAPRLLKLVGR